MRRIIAILGLLAFAWSVPALAADFKIPPTPDHYVTDNAGAVSDATRSSLENELQAYEDSTGHQIVVWIDRTTGDVPLETWTGETANQWKIGRRGHDDGAVLFIFMQDHKARIEVGYGLESALTDADSNRIVQHDIAPRMRAGDVDGAVSNGVAAMLTTISPSYKGVASPPEGATGQSNDNGTAALVIAIVILSIVLPIAIQLIVMWRLGHVITRTGTRGAFMGGLFTSSIGGGGFGGGGFSGGGFSAGGGSFGGGGASGGW